MNNSIAIIGIHTGIGKTIASAVIAEAIGADYWKPVQAGMEERDAARVRLLLTDGIHRVHDEAVLLSQPLSPHAAAVIDNIEVDYTRFQWPETDKILLVETAGGLLSPMSSGTTMADFIVYYNLPVILIGQNYLGSINHTLMTIEVLKGRGIQSLGLVMNGISNAESERFIEEYAKIPIIARIPHLDKPDNEAVVECAAALQQHLSKLVRQIILTGKTR